MRIYLFLSLLFLIKFTVIAQIPDSECAIGKIAAMQKRLQNAKLLSGQAADDNIDVTYYKLNLGITYTTKSINGEVTIVAKSKMSELSQVTIDLQNALTTDSVKIGNSKMPFLHQSNQILINLDKKYTENQLINLVIYYHGTPGSSGFNSFVFGNHNSQKDLAIWSLSEPYGASDWFPCKNAVDDKADSSDVWITADKYYVSVSNGVLQKVIENQNGTKTYQWKNRYPIAQYLISIALSNYSEYKNSFKYDGVNEMPVTHFIYPESLTTTNKLTLDKTVFMLDLFSQKFGLYPFVKEKYGHAQFGWGGGMEHQTCTSITIPTSGFETLIAHELTHQWFGDKITCKNWENIWLNEGFASYGECIYAEAVGGKVAYDNYIKGFMTSAKTAKGTIFVQDVSNINEIFSSSRTYRKGASVLHMLRGVVGDEIFYKILQTYTTSKNAYSNATTEDFQAIAEQVYGQKLDYFFKQWIYGENYPNYKVQWSAQSQINGFYKVNLNISQTTNSNPTFFTMPIQVKISLGLGDTTVTVFNNKASQSFEIIVREKPFNVVIDPNNWVLKDIETINILANEPIFGDTFGLNVFPNPSSDEVNISYQLPKSATVKISMIDFSGKEIFRSSEEKLPQGNYSQNIKINDYPAGTYIVNLNVDGQNESRKLLMVK